jgi:hypothetical protein
LLAVPLAVARSQPWSNVGWPTSAHGLLAARSGSSTTAATLARTAVGSLHWFVCHCRPSSLTRCIKVHCIQRTTLPAHSCGYVSTDYIVCSLNTADHIARSQLWLCVYRFIHPLIARTTADRTSWRICRPRAITLSSESRAKAQWRVRWRPRWCMRIVCMLQSHCFLSGVALR